MNLSLKRAKAILPEILARLTIRRDSGPIDSTEALCNYVSTRAALVAQKTLYSYLKTRMGIRYPLMFEDDAIISSINIAKMHIYAACLSDLAIFATSVALGAETVDDAARRKLALLCFERALADNEEQAHKVAASFSIPEAVAAFERRLAFWDWQARLSGLEIFSESPEALFQWAPIAPELKKYDREIVENSIKFTWHEVRRKLEKRIDSAALAAEAARGSRHPN